MKTIRIAIVIQKFLNGLLLLIIISTGSSCEKKTDQPENNNEVNASILLATGSTINIQARSTKAGMGCAPLGGGTYVNGTGETNAAVYITVYASGVMCVTSPGTYSFSCQYRPDAASQITPIYTNDGVQDQGSITFTSINADYMEGFFNATCRAGDDSVIISGSFKGKQF